MKYFVPILVFGLVGCVMDDESSQLQAKLNSYAENAAQGKDLELFLTGEALQSAQQSSDLMRSLGYRQLGVAKITVERVQGGQGLGCMDLAQVRIVDPSGEIVPVERPDRVGFIFDYRQDLLIERIELSGSC